MFIWGRFWQVIRLLRDLRKITDGYPQLRRVMREGEEFVVLLAKSSGRPYTKRIQAQLRKELAEAAAALDDALAAFPTVD
jgi:hypothetical protein